jgi:hypothetical protein
MAAIMRAHPHASRELSFRAIAAFAYCALASWAGYAAPNLPSAAAICAPFYAELSSQGKVLKTSDGSSPELLPAVQEAQALREAIAADRPGILVESAFLMPRPAPQDPVGGKAEMARVYGLLRSISALEGIEYFSVSHNAMRVLYAESYRIDGPETRKRLPDPPAPAYADIPRSESLFVFQRDLSFGANVYRYDYSSFPDAFLVEMRNLTRMSYGIVPMLAPEGLRTRLLVIPAAEGIVFYIESDSASAGPFRSRLGESFSNRAIALFGWFSRNLASPPGP